MPVLIQADAKDQVRPRFWIRAECSWLKTGANALPAIKFHREQLLTTAELLTDKLAKAAWMCAA